MEKKKHYRHELKYDITYVQYMQLIPRLKAIAGSDGHVGEDGKYLIHSAYFDNYKDKALREKTDGVQKREKFRIRWYNDDILVVDGEPDICQMIRRYAEHDGFAACRKIRENKDIPVLMLSARGEEYDKLFGFEVGVDDYVTKPFSPRELMARINVIIKRHSKSPANQNKQNAAWKFAGLEIDTLGHVLYVDGEKVELTAKEYDLLCYLANNKGIVLTRDKIHDAQYGVDSKKAKEVVSG